MFKSEIKAGGNKYRLEYTTGIVITHDKRAETVVHGNANRTSSFSVVHDDIILLDDKEKERAFQLVEFDVACREGNKLTIVWAAKKGQELGWHIAVYNHSTSRIHFNHNNMYMMCERGMKRYVFSTIILVFIVTTFWSFLDVVFSFQFQNIIQDLIVAMVITFFTSIIFGGLIGVFIGTIIKQKRANKELSRLKKDIEQFMRE